VVRPAADERLPRSPAGAAIVTHTLARAPGRSAPDDVENREALLRALAVLPAEQRIAVVLRYYLDLSLVEIADRTRTPLGTVKTRLHYGLQAMRASYEAQDRASEVRDD
jgi:RNA polymerase sigma factor (sigma-70 family)